VLADVVRWVKASYPYAVLRRFLDLELLDRSFGLAAQVFVALLPLVIVVVAVFASDNSQLIAEQAIERFGLVGAADAAVRTLLTPPGGARALSWLAVVLVVLSAFALARRISRVYGSIFGLPSLARSELWRGIVWIALQLALFIAASFLRDLNRQFGVIVSALAIAALLLVWFFGDMAGYRLLVPTVPRNLLIPTAIASTVGRIGVGVWATLYMPGTLSEQAEQFGPIGITFSLFTLMLVAVVVNLAAPVIVTVWDERRRGLAPRVALPEGESVRE
jgi:membrane protein